MKASTITNRSKFYVMVFSVLLILFWFVAAGLKLYDFGLWKQEMHNQVFSKRLANMLLYAIPLIEITLTGLLAFAVTRLAGMVMSFMLMLAFTTYVGLALLEVYSRTPCNCAGLLGQNSSWGANFALNLFVTVIALTGLIFTYKSRERRTKGMDTIVSHGQLTV